MAPTVTFDVSQVLALALQHHQAGRLAEAEALYRQILTAQPQHADALHHLGVIAHQVGRNDLALQLIRQAIGFAPHNAAAYTSLGIALAAERKFDEAVAAYHRALQLRPAFPEACNCLGNALREQGRGDEAIAAFRRALEIHPGYAEACNNLGMALAGKGRFDEAAAAYRRALQLRPDNAEAHNNLGAALVAQRKLSEAVAACRRALELNPEFSGAWTNLGTALGESGRLDEAIAAYGRAVELCPNSADAHYNLGVTLAEKGLFGEAIAAYRRAIEFKPGSPDFQSNLGVSLAELGQFGDAMACYEKALALNSRFSHAHLNIAVAWCFQGHFHEAEAHYRRAIACDAQSANAHLSLGVLLLLLGRYEEGWREYEWRWQIPRHARHRRYFSVAQWDGQPAPGQRILIHAEQGFGDTLLLLRYLPLALARSRAVPVIFECPAALVPLLRQLQSPGIEVIARRAPNEALPPFDLQLPLFSLPGVLRCFEPLPQHSPPLQADAARRAQWRERLGPGAERKVGLVWAGNPKHENDRRRSIAPEKLSPILRVPGIRLVSLQVSTPNRPVAHPPIEGVLDFQKDLIDFADSAALMAELDLIITVDTAAAHLAGTLGRPVWTLLPFVPDWRWGLGRDDTPWYPTMRLFRQPAVGDWEAVIARVATALREWVA